MSGPTGIGVPGGSTTFGARATRADTLADRRLFLTGGLVPVGCRTCGTEVLVRKNSPQHTSIQWTTDPARSCPVFAEHVAAGGISATMQTCDRLADSIAHAVQAGIVNIECPANTRAQEDAP